MKWFHKKSFFFTIDGFPKIDGRVVTSPGMIFKKKMFRNYKLLFIFFFFVAIGVWSNIVTQAGPKRPLRHLIQNLYYRFMCYTLLLSLFANPDLNQYQLSFSAKSKSARNWFSHTLQRQRSLVSAPLITIFMILSKA